MKCDDVRNKLLEAAPDALEAQTDEMLASHLRGCADCEGVARTLNVWQSALVDEHRALAPTRNSDSVADLVLLAAAERDSVVAANTDSGAGRVRTLIGISLLATAASLLLLLPVKPSLTGDPGLVTPAGAIGVEVTGDQNAIVFQTRDPNITVVWLYSGD